MSGSDVAVPRLAGQNYRVVALDDVPAVEGSRAEIKFGFDGRITGNAGVNRLMGPYEVEGDVLRCGLLAMTMMAGPPEAMAQEQRLLQVLASPVRVVLDVASGDIGLHGAAGVVWLAAAPPADPAR
jgi:heat shock protein HslJ